MADRTPLFRRGAVAVLEDAGIPVHAAVDDADQAVAAVARHGPAVLLLDARLDAEGWAACARMRTRHPVVGVVVVVDTEGPDLMGMVRAGATGCVLRDAGAAELVDAVRSAASGRAPLSPGVASRLFEEYAAMVRRRTASEAVRLTRRELQVLRLVARGLGNRDIADTLFISENTVKNHVRSVHEKLQVHSRTQAVARAVRDGLLEMV